MSMEKNNQTEVVQNEHGTKKTRDWFAIIVTILSFVVLIIILLSLHFCHPRKKTVLDIRTNEEGIKVCYGFRKGVSDGDILKEFPNELVIPEGVQMIVSEAFVNEADESTIPDAIKKLTFAGNSVCNLIDTNAFEDAPFTTINLPNSLAHVGDGAFSSCADLSQIYVDSFGSIPSSDFFGTKVFEGKSETGFVQAKTYELGLDWKPVFVSQGFVFDNLHWRMLPEQEESIFEIDSEGKLIGFIERITPEQILEKFSDGNMIIPSNVTSVADDAFRDEDPEVWTRSIPEGITKVTFESPTIITSIGNRSFFLNKFVQQINLNEMTNLTRLGDHAFAGCSNLKIFDTNNSNILSLCDNMSYLGESAFFGCSNIENILVPLITSDTEVGEGVFAMGGEKLEIIDFSKLSIEIVQDDPIHYSSDCSMSIWMQKATENTFAGLKTNSEQSNKIVLPKYEQTGQGYTQETAFLLAETKEQAIDEQNNSAFYWIFSHLSPTDAVYFLNWKLSTN